MAPPLIPACAQGGGSWERAPEQIQMLKSNGVPAVQIVVRAHASCLLLQKLAALVISQFTAAPAH